MGTHANPGDPRGSKRALIPLWLMALAFFMPSYRGCSDEHFQSAAHFVAGDFQAALWVTPVFLFALAFAGMTMAALRRGVPSRALRFAGLGSVGAFAMSSIATATLVGLDGGSFEPGWLIAGTVSAALAVWLVRTAKGRAPWQMWERLLAAFAVLAAATFPTIYLGGSVLQGVSLEAWGAWTFIGAQLALWSVLGLALFVRRQ
jgi:hypothetical protein